jgi:hypothetical protein
LGFVDHFLHECLTFELPTDAFRAGDCITADVRKTESVWCAASRLASPLAGTSPPVVQLGELDGQRSRSWRLPALI